MKMISRASILRRARSIALAVTLAQQVWLRHGSSAWSTKRGHSNKAA
jgi:hypothetical protein